MPEIKGNAMSKEMGIPSNSQSSTMTTAEKSGLGIEGREMAIEKASKDAIMSEHGEKSGHGVGGYEKDIAGKPDRTFINTGALK